MCFYYINVTDLLHLCTVMLFHKFDALPVELLEMVLLRAAAALFDPLHVRLMPRADVLTIQILSAVSCRWCHILTSRDWIRQQLRILFRRKVRSHHYKFIIIIIQSLNDVLLRGGNNDCWTRCSAWYLHGCIQQSGLQWPVLCLVFYNVRVFGEDA
jgi:hypothetical protein